MRLRLLAAGGALVLLGGLAAPFALAADGDGGSTLFTATITEGSIGSRSVTLTSVTALTSALNGETLSAPYSVTVTEAVRSGNNPWSVTAVSTDLTNATDSTIVGKAALALSARAVTPVGGGGTSSAPSDSAPLSGAVTLFSNAGQLTTTLYSGTYAGSGTMTLTPPAGSTVGVYSGTFTVTLVQ